MSTDPQFASTVVLGSALLGSAETNLQVPTTTALLLTAGASGTKVEEVVIQATTTSLAATTVAGVVYLFLYDGSTYHLFDALAITAVSGAAATIPFRLALRYANLIFKSGWSLRASQSIAGNANVLKVTALGADF